MLPERDDGSAPTSALVLLDDPLSAVDTVVGRALFDGCIGHGRSTAPSGAQAGAASGTAAQRAAVPFLQSRGAICTRVLVTHQLQYVSAADRIIVVGADGSMVAQGSPAALLKSTDPAVVAVLAEIGELSREGAAEKGKVEEEDDEDEEAKADGVGEHATIAAAAASAAPAKTVADCSDAAVEETATAVATRDEEKPVSSEDLAGNDGATAAAGDETQNAAADWSETKQDGKVRCGTWVDYGSAFGCGSALGGAAGGTALDRASKARSPLLVWLSKANGIISFVALVFFIIAAPALLLGASYWFARWAEVSEDEQRSAAGQLKWSGGGALLSLALSAWGVARAVIFFVASVDASKKLHASMFAGVVRAPNSFFERNPSGRILNRFASDMAAVDEMLPPAFFDFLAIGATCAASIAVGLFTQPGECSFIYRYISRESCSQFDSFPLTYLTIACPRNEPVALLLFIPLVAAFIALRGLYIQAAREVKRFDSLSRSPIYSQLGACGASAAQVRRVLELDVDRLPSPHPPPPFPPPPPLRPTPPRAAESLAGLAALRTFNLQSALSARFTEKCDSHAGIYFAFIATSRCVRHSLSSTRTPAMRPPRCGLSSAYARAAASRALIRACHTSTISLAQVARHAPRSAQHAVLGNTRPSRRAHPPRRAERRG
jgi:ABC-type multidrug transport system fused ATPase/permease subunit